MPRTVTQTVTYRCDRCGHTSDREYARGGATDLAAQITAVAHNGDVGGATRHDWLCGRCTHDLLAFLANKPVSPATPGTPPAHLHTSAR